MVDDNVTTNVISLQERRNCISATPPNPFSEALDALALALASHKHVWTDRERMLYETAFSYLGLR